MWGCNSDESSKEVDLVKRIESLEKSQANTKQDLVELDQNLRVFFKAVNDIQMRETYLDTQVFQNKLNEIRTDLEMMVSGLDN